MGTLGNYFKNFKLIVIENPYENWEHPEVPYYFNRMISLQKKGFTHHYQKPVIPVDTTLFFSTIVLLEVKVFDHFQPAMGFRVTSESDCKKHFVEFPILSITRCSQKTKHYETLLEQTKTSQKKGIESTYFGNWTLDPKLKYQIGKEISIKNILLGLHYLSQKTYYKEFQVYGAAVMRMNSHLLFQRHGFQPIEYNNRLLPCIKSQYLANEEVQIMRLQKFSNEAFLASKEVLDIWNNRITIKRHTERSKENELLSSKVL